MLQKPGHEQLTGRNFARKGDGVSKFILARTKRALQLGIVRPRLFADIKSTSEKLDQTELDHYISKGAVLSGVRDEGRGRRISNHADRKR